MWEAVELPSLSSPCEESCALHVLRAALAFALHFPRLRALTPDARRPWQTEYLLNQLSLHSIRGDGERAGVLTLGQFWGATDLVAGCGGGRFSCTAAPTPDWGWRLASSPGKDPLKQATCWLLSQCLPVCLPACWPPPRALFSPPFLHARPRRKPPIHDSWHPSCGRGQGDRKCPQARPAAGTPC